MIYLLSQPASTFGLLTYKGNNVVGIDSFSQGVRIGPLADPLQYEAKSKAAFKKASAHQMIEVAGGPLLIGNPFRETIESIAPFDVEFMATNIRFSDQMIDTFSAVNVLGVTQCVDMEKSEYEQTNFDPQNPRYMFTYTVLMEDFGREIEVTLSAEQQNQIVVSARIKDACIDRGLRGLTFCRAIDLTYGNRSDCVSG